MSTNLKDLDIAKCMSLNFNILLYVCLFIILFSVLVSCLNAVTAASLINNDTLTYESLPYKQNCNCPYCMRMRARMGNFENYEDAEGDEKEHFSNDELYSYKRQEYANYVSIPLLAPFDEFKNPTNMFFGQANRYINKKDNKLYYKLEIYCNLLVLDGNIYDAAKRGSIDQKYIVYLIDAKNKRKNIGDLYKDGDGIYKMKKFFTNETETSGVVEELLTYDKIQITYVLNNKDQKEQVVLEGKFL